MRVLHLCIADGKGGGAIGAYRLHRAMLENGVESTMLVARKYSDDPSVVPIFSNPLYFELRQTLARFVIRRHRTGNPVVRSLNILPSGAARAINRMAADVVQMHWVNAETISIGEIASINKPIVWKLPDMWAFSGAEHYLLPDDPHRYREGYRADNRPHHESGWDLNRWLWSYKRLRWRRSRFTIVCPSRWLAQCARESILFSRYDVHNIPNPIDLSVFRPLPKQQARAAFGLPHDRRLVLFGAAHATTDRRKGYHLLQRALSALRALVGADDCDLVVMGARKPIPERIEGFRVYSLGNVTSEQRIVLAHNVADVFVLPAEIDNLPNVVKEATACGVPCVGFAVGGMPDMVANRETGFLAKPYDIDELAAGIRWVFDQDPAKLSAKVRARAVEIHDPKRCVVSYLEIYRGLLQGRA